MTDDDLTLLALAGQVEPPALQVVEEARRHLIALMAGAPAGAVAPRQRPVAETLTPAPAEPPAGELGRHLTADQGRLARRGHHARRQLSSRRVRIGLAVMAATVVAVIVVAALVTNSRRVVVKTSIAQPPVTLPAVEVPAGTKPLDFGRLRLYVPRAWGSLVSCGGSETSHPGATTHPRASQPYYVGPVSDCEGSPDTVGLTLDGSSAKPPAGPWTPSRVKGIRIWSRHEGAIVLVDVPALRVSIAAQGPAARRAIRSLGPSSLDAILAQTAPATVPAGWKDVRFAGIQARVPPGWAIDAVTKQRSMPGVCGDPIFGPSEVYLGDGGFDDVRCELTIPSVSAPTNGLWIESRDLPTASQRLGEKWGSLPLTLRYGDNQTDDLIEVDATLGGRTVQLAIGLGTQPSVADEILSSLTASTRPPSHPTVTNPTFGTVTYQPSGSTATTRPRRRTSVRSGDGKT